jgi:hypothetical protein
MTKSSYEQALKTLEKTFEDRFRRPSGDNETKSGALASVLPLHAQEVELLAREAARYSMPLAARWAAARRQNLSRRRESCWSAST